jgi:predicted ferric reductase
MNIDDLIGKESGVGDVQVAHRAEAPPGPRLSFDTDAQVYTLVAVGAAVVLGVWWRGVASVSGLAEWLTHYGRITGLLAGYLLAMVIISMARVPMLERRLGSDRTARIHAQFGRYSLILIICHVVLISLGYAAHEGTTGINQLISVITGFPEMVNALIGTCLLLSVGFVSAAAIRSRMRYEVWHGLHLLTYVGAYLAFWHQVVIGTEFENNPVAATLWHGLYLTAAVLVLWFRVLTPIRLNLRHRFRVVGVVRESADIVSVMINGRCLDRLNAQAGQFFRWRFLAEGLWYTANPYSLSAVPHDNLMRITVRTVGTHSRKLNTLRKGTRVWAEGPYGALTAGRRGRKKVLLLAGGVGITPLRALFEALPAAPGDLSLIYRAHGVDELTLWGELKDIALRRGANIWYVVNQEDGSRRTITAKVLRARLPDLDQHDVYVCGPPGLAREWHAMLRGAGIPGRRIHHETFEF